MPSDHHPAPRRRRRIAALLAAIAAIVLVSVLALPWMLSGSLARRILTTRANQLLAPGSLEARSIRVSWFGPTVIDRPVLRDERGKALINADRARIDWNLLQILFRPSETIHLALPAAQVDVERRDDGRIDLLETLRPIIRPHPRFRVVVAIAGGTLRFRDPALADPIRSDAAEIRLDMPRDPDPVTWRIALGDHDGPGRATFEGSVDRQEVGPASLTLEANRWPLAVALAGRPTRLILDGKCGAARNGGRWTFSGDAIAAEEDNATGFGPIRAAWEGEGRGGDWTARRLALEIPYARIEGAGTINDAGGNRSVDLHGSLAPDWEAIQAELQRRVEPNARIAGQSRAWRLTGSMGQGDFLEKLQGDLGVRVDGLDVYGLRLGETTIVLRAEEGRLRIDPIDARLNDGALHLEPEIIQPEEGPIRIRFGANSTLANADVNDEVSHRVLSYIAPVLDGATRVRGRVSVGGLDAEFPLSETPGASARVEGNVVFDDVRFLPGPLAEEIVGLLPGAREERQTDGPMLALREPVSFRIADRKVYQHGLQVPIGRVGTASLEGSVDFDRRLDLIARFRINAPQADRPALAMLLDAARLEVPIGGTLDEPRIDREEWKERMKSIGSDVLERSIVAGAGGLMRLLEDLPRRRQALKPPADGPPPEPRPVRRPSAEERRENRERRRLERQEKKARRRASRGDGRDDGP